MAKEKQQQTNGVMILLQDFSISNKFQGIKKFGTEFAYPCYNNLFYN